MGIYSRNQMKGCHILNCQQRQTFQLTSGLISIDDNTCNYCAFMHGLIILKTKGTNIKASMLALCMFQTSVQTHKMISDRLITMSKLDKQEQIKSNDKSWILSYTNTKYVQYKTIYQKLITQKNIIYFSNYKNVKTLYLLKCCSVCSL